ncbi:MAG: superoxide dismutase family protein [Pirellulaceae bacterium]
MRLITLLFITLSTAAVTLLTVHAEEEDGHADIAPNGAACRIRATKGNKVFGTLTFKQHDGWIHITGRVRGLEEGKHGFHIHQFGDLRAADGSSAGGHYNPDGHDHGGPDDEKHHAGDLGNITANAEGLAMVNIKAKELKVISILGRSIVVHGGVDDLKSQPSGAAGPRVGVGVIGIAGPPAKKPAAKKTK